jgi:hypothetical protein
MVLVVRPMKRQVGFDINECLVEWAYGSSA